MDSIVRQLTELGVARILPVVAQRSQRFADPEALRRRGTRWRRIATSAAEQCGRRQVPPIDDPCDFGELSWQRLPRPVFVFDPEEGAGLGVALDAPAPEAVTLMVGPEGGWTADELHATVRHGARPVGLGPLVLRADTAGVVVATVLMHRWGDLL